MDRPGEKKTVGSPAKALGEALLIDKKGSFCAHWALLHLSLSVGVGM